MLLMNKLSGKSFGKSHGKRLAIGLMMVAVIIIVGIFNIRVAAITGFFAILSTCLRISHTIQKANRIKFANISKQTALSTLRNDNQ